ncbi:MAG: ABC transporter substrate-binding protein [Microgenomates group bacterium]
MFKTIRRYYWVSQGFLARHSKIITRTTVIVLTLILIFFFFARYIPSPKHTLRIGRIGKYNYETFPQDIQSLMSRGLVQVTPDGKITPDLAESWEIKDDGKTYIFTIKDDVYWSDGSKLTPSDISYNFKDVEVERTGDTITYHLKEPFSPFLSAVERPIIKKNKYGTGAYRLTKTEVFSGVIQSMTLETSNERRIYKFYPTETSSLTAYNLGEVDAIEKLSFIGDALTRDTTTMVADNNNTTDTQSVLFFNNNDTVLASKPTRQALAYAIEDKTFGKERTISPIKKQSWAYNNLVKTYDYDPSKAKSLLAQDVKDPSAVKLELKTMLQYLDIAESIATSWRDVLGVEVEVKVVSSVTSDYQILLADFTPPVDPDQYSIWHSTQGTNFTHFSNLKIDKLLEDGRRTSDQKLRKEIYQDFQRFLLEDCPAVFLFKSNSYTISRKPLF